MSDARAAVEPSKAARKVDMILRAPAFAYGVVVLWWSLPLAVLSGYMPLCRVTGKRSDGYQWGKFLMWMFGVRAYRLGDGVLVTDRPCMYLCNHRSWADFFLDTYITAGRGQLMSRMAVAIGFPFFMIAVAILRSGIVFKRGTLADKQKFNQWVDERLAASPVKGLLVYPEGHRSVKLESLPLKRGMLRYAFSRGMPIQVVLTANKEHVMSEKKARARFGQKVVTSYSEMVDPQDFKTFDEFMDKIQEVWDAEWAKVYNPTEPAVVSPNIAPRPSYPYDTRTHLRVSAHTVMSVSAFLAFVWLLWAIFQLVGYLLGAAVGQCLAWACAITLIVSIFIVGKPVPLNPKFTIQKTPSPVLSNGQSTDAKSDTSSKKSDPTRPLANGTVNRKSSNNLNGVAQQDGDVVFNGKSQNGVGVRTAAGLNGHVKDQEGPIAVPAIQNGGVNGVHVKAVKAQ